MSACLQVSRERLKIKRKALATMPKDSVTLALKDRSLMCFSGKENKHEDMYFFRFRAENQHYRACFCITVGQPFVKQSMLMPCSTVLKLFIKRFRASFASQVTILAFRRAFSFL